ncbi:MAG TPA: diguanylate cyclase, partial [Chthonomonadales bacterium]|nr:diguanylate cyclase [Chthonomonadales bacterium]
MQVPFQPATELPGAWRRLGAAFSSLQLRLTESLESVKCKPLLVSLLNIVARFRAVDRAPLLISTSTACCALALAICFQAFHAGSALIIFFLSVTLSAECGGLAAGLLAALFSLLSWSLFLRPAGLSVADPDGLMPLATFCLAALLQSVMGDGHRRAQQRSHELQTEAEAAVRRSRYLTEVTTALSSSLDFNLTLESVARMAVPHIADWCFIDLIDESGEPIRVAASHRDEDAFPTRGLLGHSAAARTDRGGLSRVLHTGKPEYSFDMQEQQEQQDDGHGSFLHHLKELGCTSYMCIPMVLSGETMGAVTFACAESGRRYCAGDLTMARDLAPRIALAIDNSRLYRTTRRHAERIESYTQELEAQKAELESANHRLETLATTDGLTGLHNHRTLQEQLQAEVMRAWRYGYSLSVAMLDIDHFKAYNDSFGHPAGDEVLQTVASILRAAARESDFVARYGGEEFAVLLPYADLK